MRLHFPTMVAQSVHRGLWNRDMPVLMTVERPVPVAGGMLDAQGKPMVEWKHFSSERVPFRDAVFLQMKLNEWMGIEDPRFGQQAKSRIVQVT